MTVDPAQLTILKYPAEALRRKARPIEAFTDEVRAVVARMIELMHQAEGVGLAAPQVGLSWRLFIAHVPANEERSPTSDPPTATPAPVVYINPVLVRLAGPPEPYEEGCLSIPEITGEVLRPPTASISAFDLEGRPFSQSAAGLLARCWQHEVDHLDGVLILDRMTQLARLKNRSALRELERRPASHRTA
jgi:peptide deformylase